MVEPLTAAVIVSLFFSEAIKEGEKVLGKGAADTFTLIINTNGSRDFLTLSIWTLNFYLSGHVRTENYQKKSTPLFNIQMKKI